MSPRARIRGEGGSVTVQVLMAVALSLVLFTMLTNVLIISYARGVVRAALDEGVRAAAAAGSGDAQCLARAEAFITDLLGGTMRAGVGPVRCTVDPETVTASIDATFTAWLPGVPDFTFTTEAVAARERAPDGTPPP